MQQAFEDVLTHVAFGELPQPDDPRAVDAWLAGRGLSGVDAERFRREIGRWVVYRELVRRRLRETVRLAVPRSVARLGPLFDEYFSRFLAERGPRTHYLREVTTELLDFCEPLFAGDPRVPAYALDLARHEALGVAVASAVERPRGARELGELDLERGLVFIESARVVRYGFAVHRLPADEADRSEPERRPAALFVYRSAEHEVRYLEVTPICAEILERLLAGDSLRLALEGACQAESAALNAGVVDGTAAVLADLAERGAVLGGADGAGPRDLPAGQSPPTMLGSGDSRQR